MTSDWKADIYVPLRTRRALYSNKMWIFNMFWAGYFLLSLIYSVNCGTVFKTILKPGSGECNEFRSYIHGKSTKSRKTPNVNASQIIVGLSRYFV